MKRSYFSLCFILFSILFWSCQKELSDNNSGILITENNVLSPITATLQGNILDENNQPAVNVNIKVGTSIVTTNTDGYFRISNASLDKNASLVIAEKPGYFKAYRTFKATTGANQVVIKLIPKTLSGTVNANNGGEVSLTNNSKILLPASGIVKALDGTSYTGDVNVYAAYIDPSAAEISKAVPGSFMANDKNNKRVALTSYGMLAVELESTDGERLQIAAGKKALLTIPIPQSLQSSAPSGISLWYIDEKTGLWKEEGAATKNGNKYVGEVKHFSFWNCDFSSPAVTLSMALKNQDGAPLVYANVQVKSGENGTAHGYSDSLGQVSGLVPANENLVLEVLDECYNVVFTKNIDALNQNKDLGNITVSDITSSIITVNGKLTDCSNTLVKNGYAIIYFDNITRYASVNADGEFTTTFIRCLGSMSSCKILGVDASSQQQGNFENVSITSPVTNAGNISACGTSSLQFINYKLDGADYQISSSINDSMYAYTYAGNDSSKTLVSGYHSLDNHISFSFSNLEEPGSYKLQNLSLNNFDVFFSEPLNVNLTSYAKDPGEFYEGNFKGQFTDITDNRIHNIDCSFRLRRY